jgi:hypothetical protein
MTPLRNLRKLPSECWQGTPPRTWADSFAALILLALIAILCLGMTCSVTKEGLTREHALYSAGTNAVATIHTLTPYMPAPLASTTELVLAAASGLLAAWNTAQHRQIKKLKNGNGTGTPLPPSSPGPPRT